MIDINKLIVKNTSTIKETIKIMDNAGIGFVGIIEENGFLEGIITDGDFRRAILNDISLSENVGVITNRNFKFIGKNYTSNEVKNIFDTLPLRHIPVVDNRVLIGVLTKEDFIDEKHFYKSKKLDCPVIIMAGGKGTRLEPFTNVLPKPLIPIGEKTILEIIIEKFTKYDINHFFISINYKAKIIKSYFEELNPDYKITYIEEDKPLGTIGALKYLDGQLKNDLILTNCDIIIDAEYDSILKHHKENNNDITIVASLKHYNIPYGVCEIENGGNLDKINEKPEYDFLVNTGMYVINSDLLKYIPHNEIFHATHLIEKIKCTHKIGVYPISENSWIDTGEWDEYKKSFNKLNVT